jgi:transglutaminase-like putative cysteine protease
VTGLSDRLDPGSVSQLGQSRALAFRVTFDGERPPPADLYWRGPVFWDTDGRSWSAAEPSGLADDMQAGGPTWTQQVTLEPSNQRWLFALDRALAAPDGAVLSRDGQVLSNVPLTERRHYRAVSVLGMGEERLTGEERERALALPPALATPRMRALVAGWLPGDADPAAVVSAALRHFREQPFVYTLYPPPLPENVVDGFLFDTRRGFCEHYASSFVVLMRLAGIPARVVGGYQGGEWNPVGEHLVVRQSDAHAWAEVWLEGRWQRVDPTAAVAPERIERPIDVAAAQEGSPVSFQGPTSGWLANLWRDGGWLLDGMELAWQRWVVGYTDRTQAGLLASLGLDWLSGYRLALASVIAAGLGMLPLWLLLRRQGGSREDPALRAYRRLQAKLSKAGLTLSPGMAPSAVRDLAMAHFPDQRLAIHRIVALYLAQRYGAQPKAATLRRLAGAVRRLRLPRSQ